jgi:RNA binding exosome subunit
MAAKYAEMSFHIHATEDEGKVDGALVRVLGVRATATETLYGHNGNVILDLKASVSDDEAERLMTTVLENLDRGDRARLRGEVAAHIDEKGAFFVRLDKQGLLLGHMALAEADSVRFRFRLDSKGPAAVEEIQRRLT